MASGPSCGNKRHGKGGRGGGQAQEHCWIIVPALLFILSQFVPVAQRARGIDPPLSLRTNDEAAADYVGTTWAMNSDHQSRNPANASSSCFDLRCVRDGLRDAALPSIKRVDLHGPGQSSTLSVRHPAAAKSCDQGILLVQAVRGGISCREQGAHATWRKRVKRCVMNSAAAGSVMPPASNLACTNAASTC